MLTLNPDVREPDNMACLKTVVHVVMLQRYVNVPAFPTINMCNNAVHSYLSNTPTSNPASGKKGVVAEVIFFFCYKYGTFSFVSKINTKGYNRNVFLHCRWF